MTYMKVDWAYHDARFPIVLYSELDDQRWEVRKVEVFRDGRTTFASREESSGDTILGLEPVPPLESIKEIPELQPQEISKAEFELIWSRATQRK